MGECEIPTTPNSKCRCWVCWKYLQRGMARFRPHDVRTQKRPECHKCHMRFLALLVRTHEYAFGNPNVDAEELPKLDAAAHCQCCIGHAFDRIGTNARFEPNVRNPCPCDCASLLQSRGLDHSSNH